MSNPKNVGPVISRSPMGEACVAAINELNQDVQIIDRGSYIRILVNSRCLLTKEKLEEVVGKSVEWPESLESVMPSFKGKLFIDSEIATWEIKSKEP